MPALFPLRDRGAPWTFLSCAILLEEVAMRIGRAPDVHADEASLERQLYVRVELEQRSRLFHLGADPVAEAARVRC